MAGRMAQMDGWMDGTDSNERMSDADRSIDTSLIRLVAASCSRFVILLEISRYRLIDRDRHQNNHMASRYLSQRLRSWVFAASSTRPNNHINIHNPVIISNNNNLVISACAAVLPTCVGATNTVLARTMAGHSKWANIKHRKERQDLVRMRRFTRCTKAIFTAVKRTHGHEL